MSDKDITPEQAINLMANVSTKLRECILQSLPCALEQFVTISIPGQIIDTKVGGSFVSENESAMSLDRNEEVRVNEARLVDSMVPLDKMMLGPTGKSVVRSYYSALDTLVPRRTDIGSTEVNFDNLDRGTKYGQAMTFLRADLPTSMKSPSSDQVIELKKKVKKLGGKETIVDRYVAKQTSWAEARSKLDEARNDAKDARMKRQDQQSAAQYSERQKNIKRAQAETHAKWMDWVVNGDKFRVDYAFALVDRDSVMARIERAKEATRDAMIHAVDGTEWAEVVLEPKNWAYLCQAKARDFRNRNPIDPDILHLKLDSLKRMRQSYEVYNKNRRPRPMAPELLIIRTTSQRTDDGKAEPTSIPKGAAASSPPGALSPGISEKDNKPADDGKAEPSSTLKDATVPKAEPNGKIKTMEQNEKSAEQKLHEKTADLYDLEKKVAAAGDDSKQLADARKALEDGKTEWIKLKMELQAARTQKTLADMASGGTKNMCTSIQSHIKRLDEQITSIETKLQGSGVPARNLPSAIVDIDDNRNIIHVDESEFRSATHNASQQDSNGADIWTKIAFNIDAKSDSNAGNASAVSGGAQLSVGGWWASVQADSSFSKSSKHLTKTMSECSVDGSFSAMLVTIRRPWLHAEIFDDFDLDTPQDIKLSPGARKMKQ